MRRKSKWIFIADLVKKEVGDITHDLKTQAQVTSKSLSPEEQEKKRDETEKREKALKAFQKERQKQRDLDEVAREKVRDTIRQKYGIENKPRDIVTKSPKSEERSIQTIWKNRKLEKEMSTGSHKLEREISTERSKDYKNYREKYATQRSTDSPNPSRQAKVNHYKNLKKKNSISSSMDCAQQ